MPVRIVKRFNHFGDITPAMVFRLDEVVKETAATIRANASESAHVDTGALRESMYIASSDGSDWGPRANDAESLRHSGNRPGSPAEILPPVLPWRSHQAIVGSAVAHALPNEFGTTRMPARPFLVPAVEGAAQEFFRKVQEALDGKFPRSVSAEVGDGGGAEVLESLPALEGVAEELAPLAIAAV